MSGEIKTNLFREAAKIGAEKHPRKSTKTLGYGTAGFRTKAETLDHVMYRMGLLAVLRSKTKGATIGAMVTASHNPVEDNGVKIVDPLGEMLVQHWEKIATDLANVSDDNLEECLLEIVKNEKINTDAAASVFIGMDTRPSNIELSNALKEGVTAVGGEIHDWGVVTTPMLHYFVAAKNSGLTPSKENYYRKLVDNFRTLRSKNSSSGNYVPEILFDGANGVGALIMKELIPLLDGLLTIKPYNNGEGKLNYHCGADYVKVEQQQPEGVPEVRLARGVAVDGDADRIVYFFTDDNNKFHLLDGDRIATLVAGYLMDLVRESGLSLRLGLVQTAYANGNSTKYISQTLHVPVVCVPTGVKHLHHKAQEFDIGVYFEANGHGTVLFGQKADELIIKSAADSSNDAAQQLLATMKLINQATGDALSDLLLVEAVLSARGWSVMDWAAAYTDLPNKLLKVTVKDRNLIKTADAERKCVSPLGLQDRVDQLVSQYPSGRAFIRPSGTEDVVRVYAEADTREHCDELAQKVAEAVSEFTV
ncbi:phosphoacetylglucosamine mutase [Schistocerca serialis cubense]|uniref:phosphoacetylglucosamine mutase n=1 Tax=Schistocerca serialis cubense TaxID=2023355 RepID=UPI00214F22F5|nr:phosphoacetylglucosamine mutase [Schistocerca serialis cubense]